MQAALVNKGKEGTHEAGRMPERELLYRCRAARELNVLFVPHSSGMLPAAPALLLSHADF